MPLLLGQFRVAYLVSKHPALDKALTTKAQKVLYIRHNSQICFFCVINIFWQLGSVFCSTDMIKEALSQTNGSISSLSIDEQIRHHGLEYQQGNQLRWPKDDSEHPRNWFISTKAYNTVVIIALDFFTDISNLSVTSGELTNT